MQPLSCIVDQVCKQLKISVDPTSCTLSHGKKQLDLKDPVRFAGLPRSCCLKMTTSVPFYPVLPRTGSLRSS